MTKLNFTLGPVQGFIAQARRTRDLWSGSFLLSYLSGHAIAEVERNGGSIEYPALECEGEQDKLLSAIKGEASLPSLATLPNRFVADMPEGFDPDLATQAIRQRWKELAAEVWDQYVKPVAELGEGVETIWERQVDSFWEIAWTVDQGGGLDRRKNWRSISPLSEGGTVCSIMPELQEISGYARNKRGARERQDAFWTALRKQKQVGEHDLRSDERLCAVALVKRFAPKLLGVSINWPSTRYFSAVPFLRQAMKEAQKECEGYAEKVAKNLKGSLGERTSKIRSLSRYAGSKFVQLDGDYFFADTLVASGDLITEKCVSIREELVSDLKAIYAKAGGQPSAYYAILAMDGDKLGQLLSDNPGSGALISSALGSFTRSVLDIVEKNDGVTIYAGGDDVFALFPLDMAIEAASELCESYGDAFRRVAPELAGGASISGGLVFAHNSMPLQDAVRLAHEALEHDAKQISGRDSLAISVLQGNGTRSRWHGKWEAVHAMKKMISIMEVLEDSESVSSSLLYGFREVFIAAMEPDEARHTLDLPLDFPLHELLSSTIHKAGSHWGKKMTDEAHSAFVDSVIAACTKVKQDHIEFQYGGLFVARSLAGALEGINV